MLFLRTSEDPAADAPEGVRTCDACGAAMAADQDWCLECGTAAPGRLGQRPGLRAAATVAALTLALVGGAVAASYAALSEDARVEAARPAPPPASPIAQVPPPTATAPPATVPPGTEVPPTTTPTIPQSTTPTLPPSSGITTPRITPSNPTTTPRTTIPDTDDDGDDGEDTRTTTTPKNDKPELVAVTPGADFAQLYDPYGRAVEKTDPADVHDGDDKTSFSVTTAGTRKEMGVGVVFDLEDPQGVKVVELATKTPGFRVEVYAADEELPPDILDTRWAHLVDRSDVDEKGDRDKNTAKDGKERIVLGGGSRKYRYVLLWLTTPPDDGPTVRLSEVTLYR